MTVRLVDSHCHLEPADFGNDREAVIERARAAGVAHFVAVGSGGSLENVRNAVALAEIHPDISAAIGIHPHDAARAPEGALEEIERLASKHPRVVAVGETGLDYHYDRSPREAQQEILRRFVRIARGAKQALVLHVRSADDPRQGDAHGDARRILAEERAFSGSGGSDGSSTAVVVHCFTGSVADARAWLDVGAFLSFSGILTFKRADEIREAASFAPEDRILVETDCPYLAPVPHRGRRNEPAYLVETLKALAVVRRIGIEEAAVRTTENAVRAFSLDLR